MGSTTNFGLSYPDGTDRPCEGAEQIQQLAQDYDAAVQSLVADARNVRNVPMARARWNGGSTTLAASAPLKADTVEIDTGGFLDLASFPDRITFPVAGRYVVGAGANVTAHQANGYGTLSMSGGPALGTARWEERTSGDFQPAVWGECTAAAGTYQQFLLAASDAAAYTVTDMWFWAFWIGE